MIRGCALCICGFHKPRICSSNLLLLENPCCKACCLLYYLVLRTWSQKKTTALSCLICFTRPGKTTAPALQVLVYYTILLLNISKDMPSLQNRSNCTFRCDLLRLATTTTVKSGLNVWFSEAVILVLSPLLFPIVFKTGTDFSEVFSVTVEVQPF